jgi:molybdopterin adenylyltransferase
MSKDLEIVSVNVSAAKGTVKSPVERITVGPEGVVGDAHAGPWHRQVSLLSSASIERFALQLGREIGPGEFAENLTVAGLDPAGVAVLDRFHFGDVELEVTQIGKACHGEGCAVFQEVGRCVMPSEGIFARVVRGGTLQPGTRGQHRPRTLRLLVLTLSDRAAAGSYEDRAGPRAVAILEEWLAGKRWHARVERRVLPDDPAQLRAAVRAARREGVDVVLTAGGTGVGPRDVTPETVAPLCDKLLPGVMEHVRAKYGAKNPRALLSRSIAGMAGTMQIYTLPGSVRAVEEYLTEILRTLEHVLYMVHGLDVH